MASDRLQAEALPVVDLRLLSVSELYALSLSSAAAAAASSDLGRRCEDIIVPKIDRSVFNESAGSRKQTYSRLRLAPRKPELSSAAIRRRRPGLVPHAFRSSPENPTDRENRKIIGCLQELFAKGCHHGDLVPVEIEYGGSVPETDNVRESLHEIPIDVVDRGKKRKRGGNPKSPTPASGGDESKAIVTYDEDVDRQMESTNGFLEDVSNAEDPYSVELRRRTEGLKTKEELLGFLGKVNGEWGSNRKKRKIVDAGDFGEALPAGWKLVLLIKRRIGRAWLICSGYISPNGRRFVSFKEATSYLCSVLGQQDARKPYFGNGDGNGCIPLNCKVTSGNAAGLTLKDDNNKEGRDCFSPSTFTSVNTGKLGASFTDSIIIKDGQNESQLCHKVCHERSCSDGIGASPAVTTILERVDTTSLDEVISEVHLNMDSVPKSFESKVESKLTSIFCHSRLNSSTNEYSCEIEEKIKDNKNWCSLVGNSYDEQDREHSEADDSQAKACETMNIDEHNFFLGKDGSRCTHEVQRNYESFERHSNAPHVSETTCDNNNMVGVSTSLVEEAKTEMGSGSGSRNQHDNEETRSNELVGGNCVFLRTGKEPKIDGGGNFGDPRQVKQQIPKMCSVVQGERNFGLVDDPERVLNSFVAESKKEKGSKVGLSISCEQLSMFDNNLNAVSTHKLDVQRPAAVFESRNSLSRACLDGVDSRPDQYIITTESSELIPSCNEQTSAFGNNGNEVSACTVLLPQQEKASESSLFTSTNSVENKADKVSASTMEELKPDENCKFSSELVFDFGSIYTTHVGESNLGQISTSTEGNPELHDTITCRNRELTNASCSNQTGQNSFRGSSLVLFGAEKIFGGNNNVSGVHYSTLEEPRQKRETESSLLSLSCNSRMDDVEKKFLAGAVWEGPKLDRVGYSENTRSIVGLGSNYCQPDMWRSGEENTLQNGLSYNAYPLVQSSGCFPPFGIVSNQDEKELFTDNQKFDRTSGLDGLRSGTIEPMEFDFLNAQTNSLSLEPKVSSYGLPMGQGFDTPIWLEAEASFPKVGNRHQVTTLCVWCRNEFICEDANSGVQTGSIGSMCPTCKAKF